MPRNSSLASPSLTDEEAMYVAGRPMMPFVSVVMTSYNHEEFIAEAIESVLGQEFDDLELIIVDDASTDASRLIIQKYEAKDPRIRAIFHEYNKGIPKTANDGIEKAKGTFIARIESDDVWRADKLTKQLAVLESNEDLIVWSEGEVINQKGQQVGQRFTENRSSRKKSGDIFQELLKFNYIFASSLLFKKANLGEIRYDESLMYLSDHKFALDLARKYEFCYIAEPLACYRVHGKNTLGGLDPGAAKRLRTAHLDTIAIGQEMLRQYGHAVSDRTKAHICHNVGFSYGRVGDYKEALIYSLRAIMYDPFSNSNLRGTLGIWKIVCSNLLTSGTREHNSL